MIIPNIWKKIKNVPNHQPVKHMIRLWFVQAFPESRYFVAMKHVEISLFVAAYITLYPYLHVINPS